jgi:5'(3')-deoxyribonucleotidase
MRKKIIFDMDGTIADLYGEEKWLCRLLNEEVGLFENLKPMHDKTKLTEILNKLSALGFELEIRTWTPKNVSPEYVKKVEQEKREWTRKNFPMIENIYCLPYGTPKQRLNLKKAKLEILVDDNEKILKMWETPKQRKTIKADSELIEKLQALT